MFEEDFDDSKHIVDYLNVFYKRKVLMVLVFLLVLAGTIFYTWLATPVYQSTATMIIDKERTNSPITGARIDYESRYSESLTFNTHFKLILSKDVIQRVVRILGMDAENAATKDLEVSYLKKLFNQYKNNLKLLLNKVACALGIDAQEPATNNMEISHLKKPFNDFKDNLELLLNKEYKIPPTPREKFDTLINTVRQKIDITEVRDTRLLKVSVKDRDPYQAALIANTLANQYIEFNLSNRMASSQKTLEWMNNELHALKKKLENDEKRFFEFKQSTKVFSIEGKQRMVDQKLSEFNTNYLSTRNERLDLDTKIRQIEKHTNSPAGLANIRSLIDNEAIEDVYNKVKSLEIEYANQGKIYKPKHPKMAQIKGELDKNTVRLEDELKKELTSLNSKRQVLLAREAVLKDTIGEFEQDALDTSGNELEYSILQRNLNTSKHLYDTLLARIKESDMVQTSDTSNIRLVEAAIPTPAPVSPNKKRNLLICIFLGLVAGVVVALFADYMDQTIRTEEDVQEHLDLPVLSVVPIADETVEYGSNS